jgi:signal transduction histidine kinase
MYIKKIKKIFKEILINKLTIVLTGAIIIVLFVSMLANTFTESKKITSESEKQSLLNQLYYVSEAMNHYFYDIRNDLEFLSYTINHDRENAGEIIRNFAFKQQVTVKSVTYIENFGEIKYDSYNLTEPLIDDYTYRKIVNDGKSSMKNRIIPAEYANKIDIYLVNDNEYIISFGVKSVPGDEGQSLIIITVSLSDIYNKMLSPYEIPGESHPTLKDKYGNILLHSNKEFIGRNSLVDNIDNFEEREGSEFNQVIKDQLIGKTDARIYTSVHETDYGLETKKMVSAYTPIYFLDDYWIISMTWDYDDVYSQISSINNRLILFASLIAASLAVLMGIIYYLVSNKTRLEEQAKQLKRFNSALEDLHNREALLERNTKYRTMGYMTMGIVHELNNLLTPIIGLTELIKEEEKNETVKVSIQDINVINESAVHSKELIQQVLLIGRKDKTYDSYKDIDIIKVLEKTLKVVKASAKDKIKIEKDFEDTPIYIYGNKSQLVQVLVNIAVNGIQSMDNEGKLTVSLNKIKKIDKTSSKLKNDCIEIRVSDDGTGIDKNDLDSIFLPFYTTKNEGEGTGLGLSVAKDIIEKHNGEIFIESEKGKGTDVYVYLPVLNINDSKKREAMIKRNENIDKSKICIVNFSRNQTEIIERALINYNIATYLNPSTYTAMISNNKIKPNILIVTDENSLLEGKKIARLTKIKFPDVKIIYIEGKKLNKQDKKLIDEYIEKPFELAKIESVIKDL